MSLPVLASLSAASFPLIPQCDGIHWSVGAVFGLSRASWSLMSFRILFLLPVPWRLCRRDEQSVRKTVEVESFSVCTWFREVVASRSAQASALKFVHLLPVEIDFVRRSPSGNRMCTPAPPFFTAWSAKPSV